MKERRENLMMRTAQVKRRLQPPGVLLLLYCMQLSQLIFQSYAKHSEDVKIAKCEKRKYEAFPKWMSSILSLSPAVICPLAVKLDLLLLPRLFLNIPVYSSY